MKANTARQKDDVAAKGSKGIAVTELTLQDKTE